MNNKTGAVAAFIDLDYTITNRDTFRIYLKEQYLKSIKNVRFIPIIVLIGLLRKLRVISLQRFKELSLISIKGNTYQDIIEIGSNLFHKKLISYINSEAIKTIKWHVNNHHFVFIISASPDIYVRTLTSFLGCNGYVCTKLMYEDNKFTGLFQGKDLIGIEKVKEIRKLAQVYNIDLSQSYAYSDHQSDLPLLSSVGNAIVISPTKELRRIAIKERWPILNWGK